MVASSRPTRRYLHHEQVANKEFASTFFTVNGGPITEGSLFGNEVWDDFWDDSSSFEEIGFKMVFTPEV